MLPGGPTGLLRMYPVGDSQGVSKLFFMGAAARRRLRRRAEGQRCASGLLYSWTAAVVFAVHTNDTRQEALFGPVASPQSTYFLPEGL